MSEVDFSELLKASDNEIEAPEFGVLEAGIYEGKIVEVEGKVFNSGNKGIALKLQPDNSKRKLFFNLVFSDNDVSRAINVNTLRSLGFDIEDLRTTSVGVNVLLDLPVKFGVKVKEWEGREVNEVKGLWPVPGVEYKGLKSSATKTASAAPGAPVSPI